MSQQEHRDASDDAAVTAATALSMAQQRRDAGDDAAALGLVQQSLRLQPEGNPAASVLLAWLQKFGVGSPADTAVKRVLLAGKDYYAVLGAPRFTYPSRAEYLRLSLLIHPDKSGARRTEEAFQRVTEAYNALLDDTQRAKHDAALRRASNRPGAPPRPPPPASKQSPLEELRAAVGTLSVPELVMSLELLGVRVNTRTRTKLCAHLFDELLRLDRLHRASAADAATGPRWSLERLGSLRSQVREARRVLEAEVTAACAVRCGEHQWSVDDLQGLVSATHVHACMRTDPYIRWICKPWHCQGWYECILPGLALPGLALPGAGSYLALLEAHLLTYLLTHPPTYPRPPRGALTYLPTYPPAHLP